MDIIEKHLKFWGLAFGLLVPAWASGQPGGLDQVGEDKLVRGVVEPVAQAVLVSELDARIADVPFKEGMAFKKGDVLVKFDCTRERAKVAAAEASRNSAKLAYDNNVELESYSAVGEHEVMQAKAELQRTEAELKIHKSVASECVLLAPYHGRVVRRHVNAYETPGRGNPLLEIIDDSDFRLELIVPSTWLKWLHPGSDFMFSIDETGSRHEATVLQVGASVDPVSQTISVSGGFKQRPPDVLSGMSGTAEFEQLEGLDSRSDH